MADPIYRPPLSGGTSMRYRRSKSEAYDNAEPEWYWKLSPILPKLWIRDSSKITEEIVAELEAAWIFYQKLNIPGEGDGAKRSSRTLSGRRKLEEEYQRLDDNTRRAKEVALARYPNFVIRGEDGSLDYYTDEPDKSKGRVKKRVSGGIVGVLKWLRGLLDS
ncbi:hypothetical protein EG329_000260 [Mollisiaceae sp. DMI_Dod_QoI]|nr:hypothetical protein EG329_000260 [Helotiales sp. DMI_Dod_QoI]